MLIIIIITIILVLAMFKVFCSRATCSRYGTSHPGYLRCMLHAEGGRRLFGQPDRRHPLGQRRACVARPRMRRVLRRMTKDEACNLNFDVLRQVLAGEVYRT